MLLLGLMIEEAWGRGRWRLLLLLGLVVEETWGLGRVRGELLDWWAEGGLAVEGCLIWWWG